jgi:hypothetical protein
MYGAVAFVAIALVAHVAYTYSGSGQWEKMGEQDGVTVYAKKMPGANLWTFKTNWKIHSTLSKFAAFASDETLDLGNLDVREWGHDDKERAAYSAWKSNFPWPFKPREFVIRNEFSQDPETKALLYKVIAAPDAVPPDACCHRVRVMNNTWRLTPVGNGDLEVEWIVDMDIGIPYVLTNLMQTQVMYWFAPQVQGLLDLDRYKNVKYDWIDDENL